MVPTRPALGHKNRESNKLSKLVKTSFSPSPKLSSCDNFVDVGNSAQGVVDTTLPCKSANILYETY